MPLFASRGCVEKEGLAISFRTIFSKECGFFGDNFIWDVRLSSNKRRLYLVLHRKFALSIILVCLMVTACYTRASIEQQNGLPPFIEVTDHGGVSRQQFPVTGGIPLPKGALTEEELSDLAMSSENGRQIPAQFAVAGGWPDGSVRWLLLDFQSTQDASSTVRYILRKQERDTGKNLCAESPEGVRVDTGKLNAVFGKKTVSISLYDGKNWRKMTGDGLISRIGVRQRDADVATQYKLSLTNPTIESNGPMRTVVKFEGWHMAENGDRFSPSVIRLTFYRDQSFICIQHTFVNSKDPDTHLITDIAVEIPLATSMEEVEYPTDSKANTIALDNRRFAVFQENLAQPTYPPSREFEGRYRVLKGDEVFHEGQRYPGALVLRGEALGVGVFLKDMWQMSPKALVYHPDGNLLQIGLWPGDDAGDLDLMRTEIKKPEHYQKFAREDPLYKDEKYGPTYVPHDLRHSAMGVSRTHQAILWFDPDPAGLDPVDLARLFTMPFVPFVSGDWNVSTGVMGKQVPPGRYRSDIESINYEIVEEVRRLIDQVGWYGMIEYGNVRYSFDKKTMYWMNYHPKYAWFNSGHMINGGTMLQALWYQYLRSGDPMDYVLADARGLNEMDISVVHYHEDEELVGNMIRHGGFDPWAGARSSHGEHAPLCGIPIHYYVTGSGRARDVMDLIGQRNYRERDFNHGRAMDTDINTMMLYYQFTLDKKYYDRAIEYVDYYHRTLDEAREELTYFSYRTTALRTLYEMCEDPDVRRKIRDIFLASYSAFKEKRGYPGDLEMAAFAYEISQDREAAWTLEQVAENWERRISGKLGWLDNMVLQNMNHISKINIVCYSLYWLQAINKGRIEPVEIRPDGGTYAEPVDVELLCQTTGAAIRYTLDGSEPTEYSTEYREPFTVNQSCLIRAKAFKSGMESRPASSRRFEIGGPAFSREHLEVWFKADAGVALDGSAAINWSDQSGNGRHAQVNAENAPELVSDKLNGLPVLRAGRSKYMRLRRLVPLDGDCTFIFVNSFTAGGSSVVGDGDDGMIFFGDFDAGGKFSVRFSAGGSGTNARLSEPYKPGSFCVWTISRKGTNVAIYRNGRIATEKPEYVADGTTMNLGLLMGMRPLHNNLKGDLAEILVFGTSLSASERGSIERYLGGKYGLD